MFTLIVLMALKTHQTHYSKLYRRTSLIRTLWNKDKFKRTVVAGPNRNLGNWIGPKETGFISHRDVSQVD